MIIILGIREGWILINVSSILNLAGLVFDSAGSVGATNMNEHSSRSHAIFTITIECSEKGIDGNQHVRMGKLHLVDLAVRKTNLKTSILLFN